MESGGEVIETASILFVDFHDKLSQNKTCVPYILEIKSLAIKMDFWHFWNIGRESLMSPSHNLCRRWFQLEGST